MIEGGGGGARLVVGLTMAGAGAMKGRGVSQECEDPAGSSIVRDGKGAGGFGGWLWPKWSSR